MKADSLFEKYGHLMEKYGPEYVKKVGFVYQFEVAPAKGYHLPNSANLPQCGLWT